MKYSDYLLTDHWKETKKRYWESKLPKICRICGSTSNLNLHHRTYKHLWKERISIHLHLLCNRCHTELHFIDGKKIPLTWKELTMRQTYLRKKYKSVNCDGKIKKREPVTHLLQRESLTIQDTTETHDDIS